MMIRITGFLMIMVGGLLRCQPASKAPSTTPSTSLDSTSTPIGIWRPNDDATALVFDQRLTSNEATANGMAEALNRVYPSPQYPGLVLDSVAHHVVYLHVLDDAHLTEQMGSTGSMAYMGAVTFSFTSLPGIDSVYFSIEPGSHAGPGYASRAGWQTYFEVLPSSP